MRIEGQQTYAAGREVLWSLLLDPVILERVIPGCESFEAVAANEYRVTVAVRIGQIVEQFAGSLHLEPTSTRQSMLFRVEGQNPDGAVRCSGRISLQEQGGEATMLSYEADFDVTGRPAGVSSRMLETVARSFARRSREALQRQVEIRTRVYTTTTRREEQPIVSPTTIDDLDQIVIRRRVLAVISAILAILLVWRSIGRSRERAVSRQVAEILEQAQDVSSAAVPERRL